MWDIAAANTGQSAIAAINRGSGKLYMSLSNPSGSYVNSAATDVFAEKTTFGCIAKADGHFHVVTNGKAVNEVYCEYNGVTADKISDWRADEYWRTTSVWPYSQFPHMA